MLLPTLLLHALISSLHGNLLLSLAAVPVRAAGPMLAGNTDIAVDSVSLNDIARYNGHPFDTNYRSTSDVVWSCIVTVFACTWLSVHPNVSGYETTWRQRMQHRLSLMLWGIAAPEFLVIFAYRQWMGSREITAAVDQTIKEEKIEIGRRKKWTPTHSHFLQMGGFMLTDPEDDSLVDFIDVHELIKQSKDIGYEALLHILQSNVTADEIWDRSKGDTLAKSIVALQTSWFLAQCASRGIQHLMITELEIITLAYAAFNAAMYAFWWNKPLDIQCPIVIPFPAMDRLRAYRESPVSTLTEISFASPFDADSEHLQLSPLSPSFAGGRSRSRNPINGYTKYPDFGQLSQNQGEGPTHLRPFGSVSVQVPDSPSGLKRLLICTIRVIQKPLGLMHRVYLLTGFKRPRRDYPFSAFDHRRAHGTSSTRTQIPTNTSSVPMFYAYSQAPDFDPYSIAISALAMFLASCFGAIHCIAWRFSRLTNAETLLWRICAMLICLSPVVSCTTFLVATWFSWLLTANSRLWYFVKKTLINVLAPFHNHIFVPVLLPSYLIARLVLIALAFAQLRGLPPSAHQTVEWTDFVPHI